MLRKWKSFEKRKTNKVHDCFECTVIVFKINNKLMVWGEIDIIEIDFRLADTMRKSVQKMYNVPYENIIIGTIHTHTGPETLEENAFGMDEVKVVTSGAGAAGIAIIKLLVSLGLKRVIMCDRKGAIYEGREGLNAEKQEMAKNLQSG